MKADRLIELTCHPEKIGNDDLRELDTLINRYPYFQAARTLYLKALHTFASVRFRNELKTSSIHIADHKQLYKYLNNLIEFDYLAPTTQQTQDSPLSNIVTDRIKEINGYLPVNTFGIPANKNERNDRSQETEEEPILNINFKKTEKQIDSAGIDTVSAAAPAIFPDPNVISNPIILDDIPGIITDYSEPAPSHRNEPLYEVVDHPAHTEYTIEVVSQHNDSDSRNQPALTDDNETQETLSYTPIELIETEQETITSPEEIQAEAPMPVISKQELPDMLGSYQLEDDTLEDTELSIGELAARLKQQAVPSKKNKKVSKTELIDKFIVEQPSIPKGQLDQADNQDLSETSSTEKEDLFSETLAKIYTKQKLYEKAIATYIKLSLKYPEKSVYFANRIEKIKNQINNNE